MGQKKNKTAGENNMTPATITVVLKVDLHCDGCASKITRNLRAFQGVETVNVDTHTGKITLTGIVDPLKVRDRLAMKTKKKVDLLSPQPKKEKEKENEKEKDNKPKEKENKPKEKESPVTAAVLKVALHCQGCIDRITKIVSKTQGVHNMSIDKEKDTINVKGTMDVKALVGDLMNKLKRKVEVVPPKKDKDNDKEGEGGDKEGGGGGKKKNKGGGGGGGGGGEMEQGKMEYLAPSPAFAFAYPYPSYANVGGVNYAPVYPENYHLHAPQIFSDENPNACSVM